MSILELWVLISIIIEVIFHISDCYLMLLLMLNLHLQQRHEEAHSGLEVALLQHQWKNQSGTPEPWLIASAAAKFNNAPLLVFQIQVTLLSFSVESEFTFLDYIKGGWVGTPTGILASLVCFVENTKRNNKKLRLDHVQCCCTANVDSWQLKSLTVVPKVQRKSFIP